jgi:hypothetical protein
MLTSVVPSGIAGSVYSDYASGGTPRVGYEQFKQLPARVAQVISQAGGPSLTYCYVPDLDGAVHETGTQSDKTLAVLHAVNRTCEQMAEMVRGRARLVIGADHGLADVPANRRTILGADDALSRFLSTAPTGEPTVPVFHVRAGAEAAFRAEFEERFCEFFALATPDEVEASRVFGPCPLTDTMRRRLGTFMGFAETPAKFYINPSPKSHPEYMGVHGGMSRNEVEIPLIVV